jgi:hypothetical protein
VNKPINDFERSSLQTGAAAIRVKHRHTRNGKALRAGERERMLHQTVKSRIAPLGSLEDTGHYIGFESFVERVAPALAAEGREVWVSCEGTAPPRPSGYKGVKLFYFSLKPFRRVFYKPIRYLFPRRATLTCDCVIMLGYGAGFFFIPKLFRK